MNAKSLIIFLFLITASVSNAVVAIVTNGGASGLWHDSIGFSFTVGSQPIEVYELGVYDHLNDGVNTQNEVDIWTNSGTLLVSKVFPSGTSATYDQRFSWLALATPITLSANTTYRIAAFSLYGEDRKDVTIPKSGTTISPGITFLSGYRSNNFSNPAFPTVSTGSQLIIGANMRYNVLTPPTVATGVASEITLTAATANGTANPQGNTTGAFFQWGTDAGYGNNTPTQTIGNGATSVAISAPLTGLLPHTTYHFRAVVANSLSTVNGDDATFTTANTMPVANGETVELPMDHFSVKANDTDGDLDPLTVTGVGAAAHGTATLNGDNTVNYTPDGTFAGTDTFTYTISDGYGGTATGTVTVQDTTAPTVNPPANIIVEATSSSGAVVSYPAAATNDALGVASLIYSKNSGTVFPVGTTTVTITAKDAANNTGTGTFSVTVRDTTAPIVAAHGNVSVAATSAAGVVVNYTPGSATDLVGVTSLTYSKNSGTTFPIGTTTVTITAKDVASNTGTGTFMVTVFAWKDGHGTYQALLQHDNSTRSDEPHYSGRITVRLIKLGTMTGKLEYRGLKYSFSGKLTPALNYQQTIQRKNQGSLTLSIHFDPSALTLNAQLSEFIQSGNILSDATMLLHSFHASKNPAPQAGRYTARIKQGTTSTGGPAAPAYALATISKSGVVKIKGKMSDGSALSCSAFLNEDGSSAFYDPLYKAAYPYAGYLAGSMSFDPAAGLQAVNGNLEWQKPAQTAGAFWPLGFRQTREVEGSRYIPPIRGQRVLNLTDLSGAMTFTASGPASFTNNFLLTTANRFLLVDLPNTRKLALKFVPVTGLATGLTTGSFYDSTLRKTRKLQGVVLQAQGEINGFFLGDTDAGDWTLSPRR